MYSLFTISRIDTSCLDSVLKKKIIENYDNLKPESKKIIDDIQANNNCCGIDGYQDYKKKIEYLPVSCCEASYIFCKEETLHKIGCKPVINKSFKTKKKTIFTVLGLAFSIQLLIVILIFLFSEKIEQNLNE